jgi:AP endonuclease-1
MRSKSLAGKSNGFALQKHTVPHGSYLVNMAHTDKERTEQAYTSYLDDLKRCEKLGIQLYNIHPGNTVSNNRAEAIAHLAKNINRAHGETSSVITLLENMAAGGNVLGSTFEDLRDIIALVENKDRIGVCIDTCHAFAGGYDLRTPSAFKETFDGFEKVVGFKYLRALHINDSKAPFESHRDLHANIGTGFLGLRAFHTLVNDERFEGLPLILETPTEVRDGNGNVVKDEKKKDREDKGIWAREIKMLESFVGMDVESDEFKELESRLQKQGEPERNRLAEQQERKKEKEQKKATSKRGKGKKAKAETDDEDDAGSE